MSAIECSSNRTRWDECTPLYSKLDRLLMSSPTLIFFHIYSIFLLYDPFGMVLYAQCLSKKKFNPSTELWSAVKFDYDLTLQQYRSNNRLAPFYLAGLSRCQALRQHVVVLSRSCLVPTPKLYALSHRMFGHMHGVLM
jgi:hypothetical protein